MPIYLLTIFAVSVISQIELPQQAGSSVEAVYTISDSNRVTLDDAWIIDGTLTILKQADTLRNGVCYLTTKRDAFTVITFSDSTAHGDTVTISWKSLPLTTQTHFYYYTPVTESQSDSSGQTSVKPKRTKPFDPLGSWGNIRRSGLISRGVRISQDGSGDVVSGLHLELSGRPTPDISLNAIIDDRSLPASSGGGSTTLSELDKLLFQVTTPHLSAQMGDWDMNWNIGQYGSVSRRLKGGDLNVTYPALSVQGIAASKDNSFRIVTIVGRDGDQGPYELTDKNGRNGVPVVSGSEKVHLNGKTLTRGVGADYVVDYLRGWITFNPTVPINRSSRIEVEFEHSDETYQRSFYGGRTKHSSMSLDGLSLEAYTVAESHDKDNPVTFEWSDEWRETLSRAGDNAHSAQVSGIDSVGLGSGDYLYADSNGYRIVKFSPPDSIGKPTGYLTANFSPDTAGSYSREYDPNLQIYYYQWVGDGLGEWSPQLLLPLPDRVSQSGVLLNYGNEDWQISSEFALSQYDKNLMSSIDDDDNLGSAWQVSTSYHPDTARGLSFSTKVRHEDAAFHPLSRKSTVDHQYKWGLLDELNESETEVLGSIEYRLPSNLTVRSSGGYLNRGENYTGFKANIGGELYMNNFTVTSLIDRTEGLNRLIDRRSVRDSYNGSLVRSADLLQSEYRLRLENQKVNTSGELSGGYRLLEQEVGSSYKISDNQNVEVGLGYIIDDKFDGKEIDHESDSRSVTASWEGRKPRIGGWSLDLLRQLQTYTAQPSVTSTSAQLNAYARPVGSPWNGMINYGLTTGSQRNGIQVAQYVGSGHGSYSREGDRYVPDPDGDFIIDEVMSDTLERVNRVNCTAHLEWKPKKSDNRPDDSIGTKNHTTSAAPLGLTGSLTRFEADLSTSDRNPWRGYLLDPTAFRADEVVYSRWSWSEQLSFLQGHPKGDGRLTLRYDERRDRSLSGGEAQNSQSASFRSRHRIGRVMNLRFQPSWERNRRWGISHDENRANVVQIAGESEISSNRLYNNYEIGLEYRYDLRKDAVTFARVDERRVTGRFKWNIRESGMLHVEGVYRRLSSTNRSAGYDLTRGWAIGDNWNSTVSLDYQLRSSLSLSMTYTGRWRGLATPSHSGQIELTAYLD